MQIPHWILLRNRSCMKIRMPGRFAGRVGLACFRTRDCAAGNSAIRLPDGPGVRWPDKGWASDDRVPFEAGSRSVRGNTCSWNMRRRHSSHGWPVSAARTAVKGALILRVHRSEAQTLDGRRSEGYTRSAFLSHFRSALCFQTLNVAALQSALRIPTYTRKPRRKCQAIDLPCFEVCKPEVHLRALYSNPTGDDVSLLHPLRQQRRTYQCLGCRTKATRVAKNV